MESLVSHEARNGSIQISGLVEAEVSRYIGYISCFFLAFLGILDNHYYFRHILYVSYLSTSVAETRDVTAKPTVVEDWSS